MTRTILKDRLGGAFWLILGAAFASWVIQALATGEVRLRHGRMLGIEDAPWGFALVVAIYAVVAVVTVFVGGQAVARRTARGSEDRSAVQHSY